MGRDVQCTHDLFGNSNYIYFDYSRLDKKIKDEYLLLFNIKLSVLRRNKVKIE